MTSDQHINDNSLMDINDLLMVLDLCFTFKNNNIKTETITNCIVDRFCREVYTGVVGTDIIVPEMCKLVEKFVILDICPPVFMNCFVSLILSENVKRLLSLIPSEHQQFVETLLKRYHKQTNCIQTTELLKCL